jgi:hypothetical protein
MPVRLGFIVVPLSVLSDGRRLDFVGTSPILLQSDSSTRFQLQWIVEDLLIDGTVLIHVSLNAQVVVEAR